MCEGTLTMGGFNRSINSDMRDTHDFNRNPTADGERAARKSGGAAALNTPNSSYA